MCVGLLYVSQLRKLNHPLMGLPPLHSFTLSLVSSVLNTSHSHHYKALHTVLTGKQEFYRPLKWCCGQAHLQIPH